MDTFKSFIGEYDLKLIEYEHAHKRKTAVLLEREKKLVSESFLSSMDGDTKAELSDNAWLKQEVRRVNIRTRFDMQVSDYNCQREHE